MLHAAMFTAILVERDPPPYRASLKNLDEAQLPAGDVTRARRVFDLELQGCARHHRQRAGGAPVSHGARNRPRRYGARSRAILLIKAATSVLLNGWGVGESHWGGLAQRARVKADWLIPLPRALTRATGDGHRHRRIHGHVERHGAGAPWHCAGRWRDPGDRCGRRRGQHCGRVAVEAWVSGRRDDRPPGGSGLS